MVSPYFCNTLSAQDLRFEVEKNQQSLAIWTFLIELN